MLNTYCILLGESLPPSHLQLIKLFGNYLTQATKTVCGAMADQERMVGTGRINQTGGAGTITMPKDVLALWDVDENGKDVVWFTDDKRLYAVPKERVRSDE